MTQLELIPHSKPFFDTGDAKALCSVLERRFVTAGPEAEKLGALGADILGKSWGIAVQSGTDALTACFRILGIGKGCEVAIPSYICSAPLDALSLVGASWRVVDVNRRTLSMDPEKVNELSGINTVLVSHLFGIPALADRIKCDTIIEDCAQTFGFSSAGRKIGSFGRLTVCSFYGTKLVASGHGGLIAGDEPALKKAAKWLFTHDKNAEWEPHLHYLMSDLVAALGLSQLKKIKNFIKTRRKLAAGYCKALGCGAILKECAYSRFLVEADAAGEMIEKFHSSGIEAKRPVYKPVYLLLNLPDKDYPVAKWAHEHIVSVPLYPGMPEDHVERITLFLKEHSHALRIWPPG